MSIISECQFCWKVQNSDRTYTRQTELYDGIADVMMCQNCGYAAEYEQKRIIKILEERSQATSKDALIALIKGGNN